MNFPRSLPERAFDARGVRAENMLIEREQLLATIAVLVDAMDETNYESALVWKLSMTIVRNRALSLLKDFNYQVRS